MINYLRRSVMEEILKEELRSGEKLLWQTKPEEFETLDATHKKPVLVKSVLIICIVAALCVIYVIYANSKSIDIKPALIAIAMVCAVVGAINFIFESRKLKKIIYAITDQRIIFGDDILKSLEFSKINKLELKSDADGHTSILFGDIAIKAKAHQWRSLAVADAYIDSDTGFCTRFVMYALPDAEQVKNILSEYVPL